MLRDLGDLMVEIVRHTQGEIRLFQAVPAESEYDEELKRSLKIKLAELYGQRNFTAEKLIELMLRNPKGVKEVAEDWENDWVEDVSDFEFEIEEQWEEAINEAKEDLVDMFNYTEQEIEDWDDDEVVAQFGVHDIFLIWKAKVDDLKSEYPLLVKELRFDFQRFNKMGRHGPSAIMKDIDELERSYKTLKENIVKQTDSVNKLVHNNASNIFESIFNEERLVLQGN